MRRKNMRSDIVPGARFPDYELTDHTKTRRQLSELQGNNPMILILSRGHYCPKEHQQHLELAALYPKVAVAYTQMAARRLGRGRLLTVPWLGQAGPSDAQRALTRSAGGPPAVETERQRHHDGQQGHGPDQR